MNFRRIYEESHPEAKRVKSFGEIYFECNVKPLLEQSKLQEKLERLFEISVNELINKITGMINIFNRGQTKDHDNNIRIGKKDFSQNQNYIQGNNKIQFDFIKELSEFIKDELSRNMELNFGNFSEFKIVGNPKNGFITPKHISYFIELSLSRIPNIENTLNGLLNILNTNKLFDKYKPGEIQWKTQGEKTKHIIRNSILGMVCEELDPKFKIEFQQIKNSYPTKF